jgi:ADP-heptose:LPS heptosyltransferase
MINPGTIRKIAILRALQLGDMLCAVPAIRALRKSCPHAEIVLLGLPWAATLIERFPHYFDRFIHFPGYHGLPEQEFTEQRLQSFIKEMRQEKFDLILQMQGNGSFINELMPELGAKYIAGFYNSDNDRKSNLFMSYPDHGSEISRHIKLIEHIGIPSAGTHLEFPLTTEDYGGLAALHLSLEKKGYVCVHPGSRASWRQWPLQYFAMLADYCHEQGYAVVITGTKDEQSISHELQKWMRRPAIDLTGKTGLGPVACLIKDAFMLISNCTGVSHIASAVQTPSIVISMDGEPERWGPLNKDLHITIDWTKTPHFDIVFKHAAELIRAKRLKSNTPVR